MPTSFRPTHKLDHTPLCYHRPLCSSFQPHEWLSLVPTVELLHLSSPVVEWPPHSQKNCSLAAQFPQQPDDSPLHSTLTLLQESTNLLSLFLYLSLGPSIIYLNLRLLNSYLSRCCSSASCSCLCMVVWLDLSTLCNVHTFMTLQPILYEIK